MVKQFVVRSLSIVAALSMLFAICASHAQTPPQSTSPLKKKLSALKAVPSDVKPVEAAAPPVKLDSVGDPLPAGAVARAGSIRFRPGTIFPEVFLARDGKHLVSYSYRGELCVWDANSGQLERRHNVYQVGRPAFVFLDDGKSMAVSRLPNGAGVYLEDFMKEKPVDIFQVSSTFDQESQQFYDFALSQDGTLLAGVRSLPDNEFEIQLLKAQPEKTLKQLDKIRTTAPSKGVIERLLFDAKATRLIGICRVQAQNESDPSRFALVWDVADGKEIRRFPITEEADVAYGVSPDGKILAVGTSGDVTILYDLETGAEIRQLQCYGALRCTKFSPSGRLLATGGRDTIIRIWNVASGEEQKQFTGHHTWVSAVAFAADEKSLYSAADDETIRLWDIETGKEKVFAPTHEHSVTALAYSHDGKSLVTGSLDHTVRMWDAETGKMSRKIDLADAIINSIALSPDDTLLAVGAERGPDALRLINVQTGAVERALSDQLAVGFNMLAFSSDGKWLAAGNPVEASVTLWEVATGKHLRQFQHDEFALNCLAISSDNKTIASAGGSKQEASDVIRIWNAETGEPLKHFAAEKKGVSGLAFLSNNEQLVSSCSPTTYTRSTRGGPAAQTIEDTLQLWDLENGTMLRNFIRSNLAGTAMRRMNDVAVSPDGRLVVAAERQGNVNFYDAATGKQLASVKHGGEVRCVKFSPDGRRLASSSTDTTALVWDVDAIVAAKIGATNVP